MVEKNPNSPVEVSLKMHDGRTCVDSIILSPSVLKQYPPTSLVMIFHRNQPRDSRLLLHVPAPPNPNPLKVRYSCMFEVLVCANAAAEADLLFVVHRRIVCIHCCPHPHFLAIFVSFSKRRPLSVYLSKLSLATLCSLLSFPAIFYNPCLASFLAVQGAAEISLSKQLIDKCGLEGKETVLIHQLVTEDEIKAVLIDRIEVSNYRYNSTRACASIVPAL